jgi:hypothetical protein
MVRIPIKAAKSICRSAVLKVFSCKHLFEAMAVYARVHCCAAAY